MNLWILKPGHKIKTREGVDAEVLSEIEDGERIRVRYLADQDDSLVARTEDHDEKKSRCCWEWRTKVPGAIA
jgi:hypothetical protein